MKYDNKLHRSAKGLINYNNTRTQILDFIDIQTNLNICIISFIRGHVLVGSLNL